MRDQRPGQLDRGRPVVPLAQPPAGQNKRVVAMEDSQILGFGPAAATTLNSLAVAIYAPGAVS